MNLPDLPNFEPYLDLMSIEEELAFLEKMLLIRTTEERISQLVLDKKIKTPCHLSTGQEAVAVGACAALNDDDYLFSNHRAHGHYLAKGGTVESLLGEVFCKETGCSKGRGGSMHLCDPSHGILGTSSIVAGTMGICTGPALASKIRKDNKVCAVFHGDTVMEEGAWHESANFAALFKLPLVYICENNLYSAHMPLLDRRVDDNLCEVARAHRLGVSECDGNNVLEVYNTVKKAVDKARAGQGAQFVECRTYRWHGHVGPSDDIDKGLRSAEELDYWKARCPITNFESYLIEKHSINRTHIDEAHKKAENIVENAVKKAERASYPDKSELTKNIYPER